MAPGTRMGVRPAYRPMPRMRSTAQITAPVRPKRSSRVGRAGERPWPHSQMEVAGFLPLRPAAAVKLVLLEDRPGGPDQVPQGRGRPLVLKESPHFLAGMVMGRVGLPGPAPPSVPDQQVPVAHPREEVAAVLAQGLIQGRR